MELSILKQLQLLPEHLQLEVLRYIQQLLVSNAQSLKQPAPRRKKRKLVFSDFHFPENNQTYSRSEIYGDDGR